MLLSVLISFLHFLSAISVVFTVVYERIVFKQELSKHEAKRIQTADMFYGISAGLVLIFGFLRVFFFEKGSGYYFANPFFHIKLTLFVLVGLLSIYPTIRFIKWKKEHQGENIIKLNDKEFSNIRRILNIEILFLILITLSASFMAKGIFYSV